MRKTDLRYPENPKPVRVISRIDNVKCIERLTKAYKGRRSDDPVRHIQVGARVEFPTGKIMEFLVERQCDPDQMGAVVRYEKWEVNRTDPDNKYWQRVEDGFYELFEPYYTYMIFPKWGAQEIRPATWIHPREFPSQVFMGHEDSLGEIKSCMEMAVSSRQSLNTVMAAMRDYNLRWSDLPGTIFAYAINRDVPGDIYGLHFKDFDPEYSRINIFSPRWSVSKLLRSDLDFRFVSPLVFRRNVEDFGFDMKKHGFDPKLMLRPWITEEKAQLDE